MVDKSQLLRDWINKRLEENYDYSQVSNRSGDFQEFLTANKASGMTYEKNKGMFYSILRSCCIKKGLDPATYGLKRSNSPRIVKDMDTKITPKPKPGQKFTEQTSSEQKQTSGETQDSQEIPPEEDFLVDEGMSKDICNFAYEIIRLRQKGWTPLTDDQQNALGHAWLRILQRYVKGKYFEWLIPIGITVSILKKKDNESKASTPEKPKSPDDRDPAKEQKQKEEKTEEAKLERVGWLDKIGVDEQSLKSAKTADEVKK